MILVAYMGQGHCRLAGRVFQTFSTAWSNSLSTSTAMLFPFSFFTTQGMGLRRSWTFLAICSSNEMFLRWGARSLGEDAGAPGWGIAALTITLTASGSGALISCI